MEPDATRAPQPSPTSSRSSSPRVVVVSGCMGSPRDGVMVNPAAIELDGEAGGS
ncbi:MAG: hypothetical protein H6713_19550 [Myxococcales bacterium]|nr:hypothetical protein [Myxococcales bacterium]